MPHSRIIHRTILHQCRSGFCSEQNIKNNSPGLVLPDYTRWDAAAYYDVSDDLEIRLNIENLSDELYFPFSHSTHQASVGKDLNARLSITKRF